MYKVKFKIDIMGISQSEIHRDGFPIFLVVLDEKNDKILAEKNIVAVLQLPFALFYDKGLRI